MLDNLKNLKLRISRNDHISEEDVRQALNEDIKEYLIEKYNFHILFRNEVATSVHTYIDSRYENFVIEYKSPSVNLCDDHRKQLKDYLKDLGKYAWGILTNAKKLEIYSYSSEENDFIINEKLSGDINEEQFRYICEVVANKEKLLLGELILEDEEVQKFLTEADVEKIMDPHTYTGSIEIIIDELLEDSKTWF